MYKPQGYLFRKYKIHRLLYIEASTLEASYCLTWSLNVGQMNDHTLLVLQFEQLQRLRPELGLTFRVIRPRCVSWRIRVSRICLRRNLTIIQILPPNTFQLPGHRSPNGRDRPLLRAFPVFLQRFIFRPLLLLVIRNVLKKLSGNDTGVQAQGVESFRSVQFFDMVGCPYICRFDLTIGLPGYVLAFQA